MSLYGNSIYGNAVTINEEDNGGGGGGGGSSDRIVSPDTTSSVICQNSSTIQSTGQVNFNSYPISNITQINGTSTNPLLIVSNDSQISLNIDNIFASIATQNRLYMDNTESLLVAPDGQTGVGFVNDGIEMGIASNGVQFLSNPSQTAIKSNTEQLVLSGGIIAASVPVSLPTNHSSSNPDIFWTDSTDTGLFSSFTGAVDVSCSGNGVIHATTSSVSIGAQLLIPSFHTPLTPDLSWNDSNTGFYSPSTGVIAFTSNGSELASLVPSTISTPSYVLFSDSQPQLVPASKLECTVIGPCITGFNSLSSQSNMVFTRTNGSYLSPTNVLINQNLGNIGCRGYVTGSGLFQTSATIGFQAMENFTSTSNLGTRIIFGTVAPGSGSLFGRAVIDSNGFGYGVATPAACIDISGSSGATFKMADTNQGTGKVMVSNAVGVGTWTSTDALIPSMGFIYYEPSIGTSTGFAFGVMSTQYLLNPASTLSNANNFDMPSNGRLRYLGSISRTFRCSIIISFANNSGILAQQIYFWPKKNGSNIVGTSTTTQTGLATTSFFNASINFLVSMNTNDYIELYSSNESSTTGINVHSLQIVCT